MTNLQWFIYLFFKNKKFFGRKQFFGSISGFRSSKTLVTPIDRNFEQSCHSFSTNCQRFVSTSSLFSLEVFNRGSMEKFRGFTQKI